MSDKPDNPFKFWEELKRRKVIRVIIGYLAAAYVILELSSIIAEPFGLPQGSIKLVFILLCIGLIIAIYLSWIYDFTPQGIKKTESAKSLKGKPQHDPAKRKLRVSDIIIPALVITVIILVYPKIFNRDKLKDIRDEDGRISVAVMPFENQSGDSLYHVWQGGFQNLLITKLSNSEELSVRQYQAMYSLLDSKRNSSYASMTPTVASEIALKLQARTFISGSILKAGEKIRVNAQLVNSETGEIFKTFEVDCDTEDDIFAMADSLSALIQNHLEIKSLTEEYNAPEISESFNTTSSEAFKYYIHGWEAYLNFDMQSSIEWAYKAIEADSGFVNAYIALSLLYTITGNDDLAKEWCRVAYVRKDELSLSGELMLKHIHAYYFETPIEQIKYLNQILEIEKLNTFYWYFLGYAYSQQQQYDKAIASFEKVFDIYNNWGTKCRNPYQYISLGDKYIKMNEFKKASEVYTMGLSLFPNIGFLVQGKAICELALGNIESAEVLISEYKSIRIDKDMWVESMVISDIGYIYSSAGLLEQAESNLRNGLRLDPENLHIIHNLARFLIDNDINIDEGITLVEKALEKDPDNWYYRDTRGWGLFKQGKYEEALNLLIESWEIRPYFNFEGYQHIREAEKALAKQKSEQ